MRQRTELNEDTTGNNFLMDAVMEGQFNNMGSMGSGYVFYQEHHVLQTATSRVNSVWILLDSQSTVDVFSNGKQATPEHQAFQE